MGRCLLRGFFTHNARLRATHVSPSSHQPLRWHLRLRTILWKTVLDATYSRKNLGNCGGARAGDADRFDTALHPCDTDDLRFASNIFICHAMTRMSSSTRSMPAVYELPGQVLLRASVTPMLVSSNAALHRYTRSASHYVPPGNFTLGHKVPCNKSRNMKRYA